MFRVYSKSDHLETGLMKTWFWWQKIWENMRTWEKGMYVTTCTRTCTCFVLLRSRRFSQWCNRHATHPLLDLEQLQDDESACHSQWADTCYWPENNLERNRRASPREWMGGERRGCSRDEAWSTSRRHSKTRRLAQVQRGERSPKPRQL